MNRPLTESFDSKRNEHSVPLALVCEDETVCSLVHRYSSFPDIDVEFFAFSSLAELLPKLGKFPWVLVVDVTGESRTQSLKAFFHDPVQSGHEIVLLCSSQQSTKCQRLTYQGKISDYLIVRPLYDPARLQTLIRRACERIFLRRRLIFTLSPSETKENVPPLILPPAKTSCYSCFAELGRYSSAGEGLMETIREISSSIDTVGETVEVTKDTEKPMFFGRKALVIEDDPASATMMNETLASGGFAVSIAGSIEEACELYGKDAFDVLFIDLMLPGAHGVEGIRILKKRMFSGNAVLVVTTAFSEDDLVRECLDEGVNDYLIKPISRVNLFPRVATALGILWEQL